MHTLRITRVRSMSETTKVIRRQSLLLVKFILLDASEQFLGALVSRKAILVSPSVWSMKKNIGLDM